ncbi:MAG: transposase [Opitutus sp.]|nr:transposase [Opitutus sp.]MCS6277211.1 transposase [Opitutus sp.]MCS6300333.1 transposase [Opitutus sp.]
MGTAECNSWDCVHRFLHDRAKPLEAIVFLPLGAKGSDGLPTLIHVRLMRRVFSQGRPKKGQKREVLVLMTTLLDATAWPADKLIAMYERRWVIEDWFRDIKVCFGLESFHCRSDALIEQEIYSLFAWITVCAIVERDAYRRVECSRGRQNPSDPHRFQINHSNLYRVAEHLFARLLRTKHIAAALAESEIDLRWLDSTARRRRPDRSHPRSRKACYGRWNA